MGSGNYNYELERDFVFLWGWDVGFARETERDTGFQFLRDLISNQRKNRKLAETNLSCV